MDAIPYTVNPREDTGLFNAKLGIWLFLASEVMLFGALFSTYIILRIGSVDWPIGASILQVPLGAINTLILISSSVSMIFAWVSLKENNFAKFKKFLGITLFLTLAFLCVKMYEYGQKFGEGHIQVQHGLLFFDVFISLGKAIVSFFIWSYHFILSSIVGFFTSFIKLFVALFTFHLKTFVKLLFTMFALTLGLLAFSGAVLAVIKNIKNLLKIIAVLIPLSFVFISLFQFGSQTSHHYHPPNSSTFMAIYFTLTGLHALHILGGLIVNSYNFGPGSKLWKTNPEQFTNRIEISGLYWHFVDLVWLFLFPILYLT